MAYNKRNLLNKIIVIQDITLRETKRGATEAWVYRTLIKDVYHISTGTYYRYLGRNARAELRKLEENKQ